MLSELIKAAINIKGPFALFAFIALLILIAFKTKAVPEMLFELLKTKLTREHFHHLLSRFMSYTLVAFVSLCAVAALGEALARRTRAMPGLEEFRAELGELRTQGDVNRSAIEQYSLALSLIDRDHFDDAIKALNASIAQVPTVAAQLTMAQVYDRTGRHELARQAAAGAEDLATNRGNVIGEVKAHELSKSIAAHEVKATGSTNSQSHGSSLLGVKTPLPRPGDSFETATRIEPGSYIGQVDYAKLGYYSITLSAKQKLSITYRLPNGGASRMSIRIYDSDGGVVQDDSGFGGGRHDSEKGTVEYQAVTSGSTYVTLSGGVRGTVFAIARN